MKKAALALLLSVPLLLVSFNLHSAFAHVETKAGDVSILTGWGTEPPLIGQLNSIELTVTKISDGKAVANAFTAAVISIKKGGESKPLDFLPTEKAGVYSAQVIPTQLGQYSIVFGGSVAGQAFSNEVNVDDVVDTKTLNFPASAGDSNQGLPTDFINQMRTVIADLTNQVDGAKNSAKNATDAANVAVRTSADVKSVSDRAFLVGMVGIGVGVAGIAIATIALSKRS